MIVVVIMGLLAAIALPAFTRYVRKAKTAEAVHNVSKLVQAEVMVFERSQETDLAHFVSAPPTPADDPTASKYPPNLDLWVSNPSWVELGFALDQGHYYQYETNSFYGAPRLVRELLLTDISELPPSEPEVPAFGVTASGNLDGDDTWSQFTRTAGFSSSGDIVLNQLFVQEELE